MLSFHASFMGFEVANMVSLGATDSSTNATRLMGKLVSNLQSYLRKAPSA